MIDTTTTDPINKALRALARLELTNDNAQTLETALKGVHDWNRFFSLTERHGLSPLFHYHLSQLDFQLDKLVGMQLKALVVRHRRAHQIRTEVIIEFLTAFKQASIDSALLKGAALAHLLYPEPNMRPMGDVDVLVATDQAQRAQQALRDLGYSADEQKQGYLFDHHHLPIASNHKSGMQISIEVHHNALSGDVDHSIALHDLSAPLQSFEIEHITAHALSHSDTLRHLCHHTFEPADIIKLGSIVDFVAYADKYVAQIDWPTLDQHYPFVSNALRCIHFLTPLPTALSQQIPPPTCRPPLGVGHGFMPLSEIIAKQQGYFNKLKTMLQPSAWWMHIFYHVPPEHPLWSVRLFRHPWQIGKWLFRRYHAAWRSRSAQKLPS